MSSTPLRPIDDGNNSTPVQTNYARLQKKNLRSNIKDLLQRFKFKELISDVVLGIFDLEPEEVKEKMSELRLPSDKDSVATLLSSRTQAFSVQDLEEMYHLLLLYRTAFDSKKKKWTPVNLLEPADDLSFATDENLIRLNILQGLRIKGLNAVVKVITHEDLIWVMIIEKKLTRRRGIKLMTPLFICYEIGTPYIFTASKINETTMECLLRAMKYKKHKLQHLEGRDVKSLLSLLKHKTSNRSNQIVPCTQGAVRVGHRYFDVSKKQSRETYVNRVFDTKDPIILETFNVRANTVWRGDVIPGMQGEPFTMALSLQSKNLVGMIKHMSSIDMINTPLPDYLQEITRSGKNQVCMKSRGTSK
ncbi:uncharacterized protein LOC128994861 [Macrosteles quadrilineatus]|uniref:uncharacterized protein LOC128994861 n=1 Tax=Macrosteles quadrilineatus TaxID=74068 RepID=UPI0023E29D47|nr:uncharacterized protein LOC128994861 [Macrosteles quadrilineatus]